MVYRECELTKLAEQLTADKTNNKSAALIIDKDSIEKLIRENEVSFYENIVKIIKDGYISRIFTHFYNRELLIELEKKNIYPVIIDLSSSDNNMIINNDSTAVIYLYSQINDESLSIFSELNKIFRKNEIIIENTLKDRTVLAVGNEIGDEFISYLENMDSDHEVLYRVMNEINESSGIVINKTSNKSNLFIILNYSSDAFFAALVKQLETERYVNELFDAAGNLVNSIKNEDNNEIEKIYLKAIENFIEILKYKPDNANLFNNIGSAYFEISELKEGMSKEPLLQNARKNLEKAIELNKEYPLALNNLGIVLTELSEIKTGDEKIDLLTDAKIKLNKALFYNPDYYEVYNQLGNVFHKISKLRTGDKKIDFMDKAAECYNKVLEKFPDNALAYYNLGFITAEKSRMPEEKDKEKLLYQAKEYFEKAIKFDPEFYAVYNSLGYCLGEIALLKDGEIRDKELRESIKILVEGEKLKKYECMYNLACYLSILGDKEEAVKNLIEIIESGKAPKKDFILRDGDLEPIINDPRVRLCLEKYNK